jgi:hypothetical protein
VLEDLEALSGWVTNRVQPPVLILGRFDGVETGIRQLRRAAPLETEVIAGIKVPTLAEMLRIKAWLVVTRNALRDYVDVVALADAAKPNQVEALSKLDELYPQAGNETVVRQLTKQLAEPKPYDLASGEEQLTRYRDLVPPWDRWSYVESRSAVLANELARTLGLDPGRWRRSDLGLGN